MLEVVTASHILCDLVLGRPELVHDYLADDLANDLADDLAARPADEKGGNA